MMKRILHLTLLLLSFTAAIPSAYSQVKLGLKAGLNVANADFNHANKANSILRFNAGLLTQIDFNQKLYLQPELLYSIKGWGFSETMQGQAGKSAMNLHYLTIPVLLGYRPIPALSILAGPEIGFLMKARQVRSPWTLLMCMRKLIWVLRLAHRMLSTISLE